VVIRNVPAFVCTQCGEDWIDNPTSAALETIALRAKKQNTQLEMVSMAKKTPHSIVIALGRFLYKTTKFINNSSVLGSTVSKCSI
jgi:hypothetical protein